MLKRIRLYRYLVGVLVFVFALVGVFSVAAQQDTSQQPYLGIGTKADDKGVLVEQVVADSPAAKAGLKIGDIITAIDGKAVTTASVRDVIGGFKVGDTVKLGVTRGSETLELSATLAARPAAAFERAIPVPAVPFFERPRLGVRVADTDNGVVIRQVMAGTPAEQAGLKADDVISKVGDQDVKTARDLNRALANLKAGDKVTLVVKRGSETVTVEATLASAPAVELSLAGRGVAFAYDGKAWELRSLNEQSPLYTAGLRQGDKLTQFDGKAYDPAGLVAYLNSLDSQASVKVTVERDGKTQGISVPVEALKAFGAFGFRGDFGRSFDRFDRRGMPFGMLPNRSYLGVQFLTLDENVAKERNLTQTEGALITEVQKDSPAEKAGLKVNDIITAVEGDKVDARRDLRERLFAYESGDKVKLDIIRDGKTSQLEVTLERAALGRGMLPMFRFGPRGFRFFGPGMSDLPDLPFELQQPDTPAAAPQGPSL